MPDNIGSCFMREYAIISGCKVSHVRDISAQTGIGDMDNFYPYDKKSEEYSLIFTKNKRPNGMDFFLNPFDLLFSQK